MAPVNFDGIIDACACLRHRFEVIGRFSGTLIRYGEEAILSQKLLVGIDGGGTHSTAVAAYPDGRVAAVTRGGGLNYHNSGIETVRLRLESMVETLYSQCGGEIGEICVGMSALDAPADEETRKLLTSGTLRHIPLDLQSDAYIALMGFTLGQPGVVVICGTGSMLMMLDKNGCQHVAGGWGYRLGDPGSGYTLAREGLLSVIESAEGEGPETLLAEKALAYFGADSPRGLIDRIYAPEATTDWLAGYAKHVLTCAMQGDAVARKILSRNMGRLAKSAARLILSAPEAGRVGLYGGIFYHSKMARELFVFELLRLVPHAKICSLDYSPEQGALIHLFQKRNALTNDVLALIKSTYEVYRHECD